MKTAFDGFEEKLLTFLTDNVLSKGQLVVPASGNKVSAAEEDDEFMGVVVSAENGYATVLMKGIAEIEYSGTISAPGYYYLAADEDGAATPAQSGKIARLVLGIDSTNGTIKVLF